MIKSLNAKTLEKSAKEKIIGKLTLNYAPFGNPQS